MFKFIQNLIISSFVLSAFNYLPQTTSAPIFSCKTDGIFPDDSDCHSYFECLWVSTPLERQEHVRCQSELIFNPIKVRCDTVLEYQSHLLGHGIKTKTDLIELIRFSNCIGYNLLQNMTKTNNITTKHAPQPLPNFLVLSTTEATTVSNRNFRKIENTNDNSVTRVEEPKKVATTTPVVTSITTTTTTTTTSSPTAPARSIVIGNGVFGKFYHMAARHADSKTQNTESTSQSQPPTSTTEEQPIDVSENQTDELSKLLDGSLEMFEIVKHTKVNQPDDVFKARKLLSIANDDELASDDGENREMISVVKKKVAKPSATSRRKPQPQVRSHSKKFEHLKEVLIKAKKNIERKNRELSSSTTTSTRTISILNPGDSSSTISAESHYTTPTSTESSTTFFIRLNTTVNPHMQTYKINQTRKLFGSLKMDSVRGDMLGVGGGASGENLTKINEVERGGKFQRLRLAPTDTLIECKENDFGLECSCSITLSPPKCKQLISSFLSSCRILGCKNNGKCINMAFKYPIPYVCSCPSGFMGSYCEIATARSSSTSSRAPPITTATTTTSSLDYSDLTDTDLLNDLLSEDDRAMRIVPLSKSVEETTTTTTRIATTTTTTTSTTKPATSKVSDIKPTKCEPNPCMNGGACELTGASFTCKCISPMFSGRFCQMFARPSAQQPTRPPTSTKADFFDYDSQIISKRGTTTIKPRNWFEFVNDKVLVNEFEGDEDSIRFLALDDQNELDEEEDAPAVKRKWMNKCPSNCNYNLKRGFCRYSTATGEPFCSCHQEWTGFDCGSQNYCFTSTCQNNSTCINSPKTRSYICKCLPGYTGPSCEQRLNKVATLPRMFQPPAFAYRPQGTNETIKQNLSTFANMCLAKGCLNNGACVKVLVQNSPGVAKSDTNDFVYICKCPPYYDGPLCEHKVAKNACEPNPCTHTPLVECKLLPHGNYECVCPNGGNCLPEPTTIQSTHTTSQTTVQTATTAFMSITVTNTTAPTMQSQRTTIPPKTTFTTSVYVSKDTLPSSTLITNATVSSQAAVPVNSTRASILHSSTTIRQRLGSKIATRLNITRANLKLTNGSRTAAAGRMIDTSIRQIYTNPCELDPLLCRKQPNGNESFICVKSFVTQDYTLCMPRQAIDCKTSNPCMNEGICVDDLDEWSAGSFDSSSSSWRCICSRDYTGRLCETEICAPVSQLLSNHSMCAPDSEHFARGEINSTDIDLILDFHNAIRRQVAPIPANMQKMYWDVRLQNLAQKRAQLCSVDNINILTRQHPGYGVVIGENLAAGYEKWPHVLTSWASERKNFVFKSKSSQLYQNQQESLPPSPNVNSTDAENLQAGHYTQMIFSSASRIGCGFAECANTTYDRYFVCYYGEMQTYHSRNEPYQDGKQCSSCPNTCLDGLCDCGGVYCSNGGVLDLNTCTCKCPYPTFSGPYCENVSCPEEDSQFCSGSILQDKCWLYPVVRATCPYMCSICDKSTGSLNKIFAYSKLNEGQFSNLTDFINAL